MKVYILKEIVDLGDHIIGVYKHLEQMPYSKIGKVWVENNFKYCKKL